MDGITLKSLLVKSSVLHRTLSFVMFKVPQRQQLQSIHRLLNVPPVATVKLGNAYQFEKFGTGNSLLRYGIDIRCSKRPPGVRDAFSEAFGVKNRLFRYGRDIRYQKPPSTVRDRHSVTKKGSWGTRCIFKGAQNSTCYIERIFKGPHNSLLHRLWTASCRTGRIFRGVPCQKQHLPTARR
mgnify:CR=1 FL=1